MTIEEARELIADSRVTGSVWADLGCGEGTFTLALATVLPAGSVIHAVDHDAAKLRRIPPRHAGTSIHTHLMDFASGQLPFAGLDGILLANALHYVRDKAEFLNNCEAVLAVRRFVVVEYDTQTANSWVPYPIDRATLTQLFRDIGYPTVDILGSRESVFRRAQIYGALALGGDVTLPRPHAS